MNIHIKSNVEIEKMRKSGQVLAFVLDHLKKIAKAGMTTKELDVEAEKIIRQNKMLPSFKGYNGFPASICTPINEEVVHTIPSDRRLKDGDLLTVDAGVTYEGLITDAAVIIPIGSVSKEITDFIKTAERALTEAILMVKPGNRVGDISNAIQKVIEGKGYSVVRELTGHGVGYHLHEEPTVYNYGKKGSGVSLKPGMAMAIEPIFTMGQRYIKTLKDNWNIVTKDGSLATQIEHTVLVTANGCEILTLLKS
ncbi:MAG: methionine aminopeptidase, type I, methionyl aminopeptidase [Candidatus Peregrinibacteria bacterium GW2011_GWF2_33_10]|nr:MAG: methionine aminopeptidase, type I, methionyl aminopeptidase [Candidatus Peregrinibacteria bacterium GW2011_GWF2_33_10]OGJ46145.1 MAG: type I methionyl aminopeptidase [Candidatus Peregrinibacteria bacterium RIFOXYA12_FULL_33_12]OGJ46178.1 MAG: type I methionyl aminopeptidase [Candidatus Peregrinibacteria bacterium RIFOXYA2_FULL_33_21]OGJ51647.1 MAG: type I methionyl aminopeptidase [Candidatus Peregrinibacteria bacterium RIFOXYB2_FULL_33_20]